MVKASSAIGAQADAPCSICGRDWWNCQCRAERLAADPCPVRAVGYRADHCQFTTPYGEPITVPIGQLASLTTLDRVFAGQTGWLLRHFPRQTVLLAARDGGGTEFPVGIDIPAAALHLANLCTEAQSVTDRRDANRYGLRVRPTRGWLTRILDRMRSALEIPT